jgi:N6-adenosine-specific RNA methylase IME4
MQAARVIVADPAWSFSDRLPGKGRGAEKHYRCMSLDDIKSFELPPIWSNSVLFLWRVAAMQQEALDVAKAWGFTPKSELVWQKLTRTGKQHFGMGHYVRASHEVCLICVRGRAMPKHRSQRSVFSAPVGRHSEKPTAFYDIVREMYDGPRVALFERKQREGFECFGDQLEIAV